MEALRGKAINQKAKRFSTLRPALRAGILGGGQLARMLIADAVGLGLRPVVYAESAEDPAARLVGTAHLGLLIDRVALGRFLSEVDFVVFENEFVRCDLLASIAGDRADLLFVPSLATLEMVRDKARQKVLLTRLSIP